MSGKYPPTFTQGLPSKSESVSPLPREMADVPDRRLFLVDPFKVLDSLRKTPLQLLYAALPPQNLEPYGQR